MLLFTLIFLQDEFSPSYSNIGMEVRTLRKALNLPVDTLPKASTLTSNHWRNQNGSRTYQVFLADSGYSSKANGQSTDVLQSVLSPTNVISGAQSSAALGLENFHDVKPNPMSGHFDSWNSSNLYERSLKSSLDESETKRMLLLEKLREGHLTIQVNIKSLYNISIIAQVIIEMRTL